MSIAGNTRYVRVFDLPPEVADADLIAVMAKYGTVKRTVRERFPAEFQLNMFTGVRGIHMDIDQDIPEVLFFQGRKGRVYYIGVKQKCFTCNANTHLKKSCPLLREQERGDHLQQRLITAAREIEPLEESEKESIVDAVDEAVSNGKKHQKKQKKETKRQRSFDSEPDFETVCIQTHKSQNKASRTSSSDSESNMITVADGAPIKSRHRIPTYEWIDDECERRLLIEEDKQRIAVATNTPLDQIIFYNDSFQ